MIPDAAVEAAARAGFSSKLGWATASETYKSAARAQARTALEAAAPHLLAAKAIEVKANHDHIIEGGDGYTAGFHYALHCIEGDLE